MEYRRLGRVALGIIGRLRRTFGYAFRFPHASRPDANFALTGNLHPSLVVGL